MYRFSFFRRTPAALILTALVMLPGAAAAQSMAPDPPSEVQPASAQLAPLPEFAALAARLRTGDTVTVTGTTLGTVKGRFVHVSEDHLVIRDAYGLRSIAPRDVDRISRRRKGVLLGTIVGLSVGTAFAIPLNMWFANEGANATAPTVMLLAASTGVGVGIDALIDLPRTVYRRDRQPKVRVAPQFGRNKAGVAMQVSF